MKKIILLFVCLLWGAVSVRAELIDSDGQPVRLVKELLRLTNIKHDGTLDSIVAQTQRSQQDGGWLRAPGKERWEVAEVSFGERTTEIVSYIRALGCCDEVRPTKKQYRYALIFGATVSRVYDRLVYLQELMEQGVSFDELVLLGGKRQLDPQIESAELVGHCISGGSESSKLVLPTTEGAMMQYLFEHSTALAFMRSVHPRAQLVDAPMIKNPDGSERRPTTGDTIMAWLATNPEPGDCVLVSNNPYIGYQDSVARTYITKKPWVIETVGRAASAQERMSMYLDTMARWLYQERERYKRTSQGT